MDALSQLVQPLSFLFFFVFLWLVISGGLALAAGWTSLAAKFRQTETLLGERFTSVSGAISNGRLPVGYRSCLTVSVGQAGFSLAVLFPFRFLSPPLLIPWSEVETVLVEKLLRVGYTAVRLRHQRHVIFIRGPAGRRIMDAFDTAVRQTRGGVIPPMEQKRVQ
jgi:hypothetical protein